MALRFVLSCTLLRSPRSADIHRLACTSLNFKNAIFSLTPEARTGNASGLDTRIAFSSLTKRSRRCLREVRRGAIVGVASWKKASTECDMQRPTAKRFLPSTKPEDDSGIVSPSLSLSVVAVSISMSGLSYRKPKRAVNTIEVTYNFHIFQFSILRFRST